ncbi:hypothetical protein DFR29_103250 [Tahibacter aquaticus]|uniref:Tandem-95 repeat protein n=1 Tax=Tahibacter aquaticus TaxID=520092 RepID=A0A4R6Z500_9GAMM|nr:Ig-like domain-containing protein [Tahibacter aquaticus]TDR46714.1 hypothetical protein DFR29_103250 [Tahibacter aquaticus]
MTILSTLPRLAATLALLGAFALPVSAATVTLVPGNGFSDTTPRTPEGGNNGTTLGQQRTNLFNAAAQVWGAALTSTQTIKVQAAFETLTCSAASGTLGSAGATGNYILTDGVDDRYYAVALAEALTGQNLNATASNTNEISATFNARVDLDDTGCLGSTRFYYGLTGPAPAGTIALYPVVLHELGHGLGFAAFICRTSPQCTNTSPATPYGAYFFNVPDIWSDTIRDNDIDGLGTSRRWSELTTAERVVSFTHDPFLVWNGMTVSSNIAGQAAIAKNEDRLRMYAPSTFVPGSSISHFHSDASPSLLMEPSLSAGVFTQTDLTDCLFADIGWIDSRCATVINATPTLNALPTPVNLLEDAGTQVVSLSGIGDNDALVQELSVAAVSGNTALIANPAVTYTNPDSSGSISYTPQPNQSGSAVITVGVFDDGGWANGGNDLVTRQFTVNVTAVNDAPVIASSAPTTATEAVAYNYAPAATDVDGPGQTWSLVAPTHTCGGSINASGGAFTFTPAGPTPPASCVVALQICDGGSPNLCAAQTTSVSISAVNSAPAITSSAPATATEDLAYTYNATRSDPDGPGQTWSLVSPTHTCGGSIGASSGAFTFTPAGPVPPASCVVAVQVCDGGTPNLCAMQTTTVSIAAVNDAPVIDSSAATTATEDVAYSYNATRSDADGPGQSWSLVAPTHTCSGSINASSGAFAFTPPGPLPPASCVVAVQVCDGATPSLCATQTTTVTVAAVNDAPVISSSAPALAIEDAAYSYNPSRNDPDGPGQSWSLSAAHTCGGSIVPATGAFSFTPAGPVPPAGCVVSVEVCDGGTPNLCSGPQTTSVGIMAINDPPVATAPANVGADEDTPRTFSGSERLALGDADSASVQVTLTVNNGRLSLATLAGLSFLDGDGSDDASMRFNATPAAADAAVATLSLRPSADYNGSATLNFSVDDGAAAAVQRSIAIAIAAQADIVDDTVGVLEDSSLVFNVISGTGGASPDNFAGTPILSAIGSPSHGTATFAPDGSISYTPAANFSGSDSFGYSVNSGGVSESGGITISIAAVNDPPTLDAIPNPALISVDAGLQTVNLGGIGPGGGETTQTLMVTAVSDNPSLIANPAVSYTSPGATGTLTYTPQPGQHGTAIITVSVTDSGGTSSGGIDTVSRSFSQVVGVLDRIFANGFQQP